MDKTNSDTLPATRVVSVLSSEFKTMAEFDAAVENAIARMKSDGYELDGLETSFSSNATLVPVAPDKGGRIVNAGGGPTQLQLIVNQMVYTQLLFVKAE